MHMIIIFVLLDLNYALKSHKKLIVNWRILM